MTEVVHSLLGELFHILDVTYTKNELALSLAIINLGNNNFATGPRGIDKSSTLAMEAAKISSSSSRFDFVWSCLSHCRQPCD